MRCDACHYSFQYQAAAVLGIRKKGDLNCRKAVTKQKLVTDVCFPVCTVPPFLPLSVAPGFTLSENFQLAQPPTQPVACSAGTQTPFPLESNASIRFCTEWCQPRGLACNRPLPQTGAHRPWMHSQRCSNRWMANRDAPRSKSTPAAGWWSPAVLRGSDGTYCVLFSPISCQIGL